MAGAKLSIGAPKGGIKKVGTPANREFVMGSRPPALRATTPPAPMRIKPMDGQTQYGKSPASDLPSGASAGNTGQTPWS
jgi:hypothetical protein